MRRKLSLLFAALFCIASIGVATGSSSAQISLDILENCQSAGLEVFLVDGQGVCSHGGDTLSTVDTTVDAAEPSRAPCYGTNSGKRIVMIYGRPSDRADKFTATRGSLREIAAQADMLLDDSSQTADQHIRWHCGSDGKVTVLNVTLKAVGSDAKFTFDDMYNSLVNQGYTRTDRIYVTYVDQVTDTYEFGGQGTVDNDPSSASTNLNNTGPAYSLVAYLNAPTFLHEIGHNLGAVQLSAPHATGRWHCWDDQDLMCYNDGGNYVQTDPLATLEMCPVGPESQFDCNHNDYWNPSGGLTRRTGGSLWNTANNGFLTSVSHCSLPTTC